MLRGITTENVHYWTNTQKKIMVSIEDTKTLLSFDNADKAINWLYLNGFKQSARELNADKKGYIKTYNKVYENVKY